MCLSKLIRKDSKRLWRVPTNEDWDTLVNYLIANGYNWDGTTSGNKIAKSIAAKTDWDGSSVNGAIGNDLGKNNASGFSALPGGFRTERGFFFGSKYWFGSWWSATESNVTAAPHLILSRTKSSAERYNDWKKIGSSLRLVRDVN